MLGAGSAGAATIVVGVTQDVTNGGLDDLGCTLRDAIDSANQNKSIANGCNGDNAGPDTIVLEGGKTYTLSLHAVDESNAKGDLDITGPVTIRSSGPGLATIDAASNTFPGPAIGGDRVIDVKPSAGAVTLEALRITDGFVDNGAGVDNGGGGIRNESNLSLLGSEVVGNKAVGSGQVLGGGIYSRGGLANLTLIGSTVAGNEVLQQGFNVSSSGAGGGIAAYKASKTLTITNSTVAANTVAGWESANNVAGGVFAGDGPDHPLSTFTNVTITGNAVTGANGGGGMWFFQGTLTNTVVAGNTDPPFNRNPDCRGFVFPSGGGNVLGRPGELGESEDFCGLNAPTDIAGTRAAPLNPNLGTLVDNGGLTRTMVPNPGSPLIGHAVSCLETDQRGFFRAPVAPCDTGAVEVGAPTTLPGPPPAGGGGTGTPPGGGGSSQAPPSSSSMAPAPTVVTKAAKTGKRAAALAKCKLKKTKAKKARCRAKARKLPV